MEEQKKEAETTATESETAGYGWFTKTDFMDNLTVLWEGVETVAAAQAEADGLDRDEFLAGCSNAFADAVEEFLFGDEEEKKEGEEG